MTFPQNQNWLKKNMPKVQNRKTHSRIHVKKVTKT
jgi:hypothetical protein